jgi:membrane-associated protease RseP (regulator of RpoE activity)
VRTATQGVQAGWADFLNVLVVINVFIGLLNLLPMLPLDGGHVVVAVYERIRSRRGRPYHADVAKLTPIAYSFMLLLAFVVLSAFYLDITHPIPNPFK